MCRFPSVPRFAWRRPGAVSGKPGAAHQVCSNTQCTTQPPVYYPSTQPPRRRFFCSSRKRWRFFRPFSFLSIDLFAVLSHLNLSLRTWLLRRLIRQEHRLSPKIRFPISPYITISTLAVAYNHCTRIIWPLLFQTAMARERGGARSPASTMSTSFVAQHTEGIVPNGWRQEALAHDVSFEWSTDGPPQHSHRPLAANATSTGKGILIGMLSAFGSAALVALILGIIYFFRYTQPGRIFLDRIGRPGEYDDEQAFAREEAEALEEMDDIQRTEYLRAKGTPLSSDAWIFRMRADYYL